MEMLLLTIGVGLALPVAYLLLLTLAATRAPRRTALTSSSPLYRFAILIPAHNEAQLLPGLLLNLQQLDYPAERFRVHVVADNCSDSTAEVAHAAGATVHERFDTTRRGKGHALNWLLDRLWQAGAAFDAIVILDADSLISPNFLRVMSARVARGERVVQAYYAVRDADLTWNVGLRAAALAALHWLRPQARMALGGSAGLKGNGMLFTAAIARRYRWPASLTEDIEQHMALILAGERVYFAPDATVWAEMPGTLAAADSQHARWEQGRIEMLRGYVPRLLRAAMARRSFLLLDAAIEQIIPPFSLLVAACLAYLAAAALLGSWAASIVGLGLLLGQAIYLLAGLRLARAPRSAYRALLFAPLFIAWKLWLYLRVLLGRGQRGWVRTSRNQAKP